MKDSCCGWKEEAWLRNQHGSRPSIPVSGIKNLISRLPLARNLYVYLSTEETLTPDDLWLSAHIQSAVIPFSGAHIDPRDASKKNLLMDLLWADCIEYKAFEQEPEGAR